MDIFGFLHTDTLSKISDRKYGSLHEEEGDEEEEYGGFDAGWEANSNMSGHQYAFLMVNFLYTSLTKSPCREANTRAETSALGQRGKLYPHVVKFMHMHPNV